MKTAKHYLKTITINVLALSLVAGVAISLSPDVAVAQECEGADCIQERVRQVSRILSGGVGIVIAIMGVTGGIQYITAAGNPQKISAAKGRIGQALAALFLYIFGLSLLNWLVPGAVTT